MKHWLGFSLAACLLAPPVLAVEALTEFQQFRSYPFLDRAYREAERNNWAEVERLMRDLLLRVPNNEEARQLLVEALSKQRRYRDAEEQVAQLSDGYEALFEMRLAWIEQDPPTSDQVERWLAQTEGDHRVRLWQAYSLTLAKFGGAKRALDWLNQIPIRGDGTAMRMARANWAERLHDWETSEAQLAPLEAQGTLEPEDWQRLANARVQLLDEDGLQRLLKQPPSAEAEKRVRLAMLDRAVALGRPQMAQRWLDSLPEEDRDTVQERARVWELARQGGNSRQVRELSEQLGRPCLETAEWLSRHDRESALQELRGCRAEEDPQTWLVLAQRLNATDLLAGQTLPGRWDISRQERLLEAWQAQGRTDLALAWLARQPQTTTLSRRRAELLQASGQLQQAERQWLDYYRRTGDLQALDQASFLALQAGRREEARQWLEQAFETRRGNLSASLLQRLGGLYTETGSTFDPARARALLPHLDAQGRVALLGRLAESGDCAWVRQAIGDAPQTPGELRVLGRCAMPQRPGEAVVLYRSALAQGDEASRLPLAYALDAAGDAPGAWAIWQQLPLSQLDRVARLTAARSALGAEDSAAAERYWRSADARSADDWALGATIAQARNDLAVALQRQRTTLTRQPNGGHYYAAAATAQAAGETQQSTEWLAEAVRLEPDHPRYNADYAMRLAAADTPAERRTSIARLERATHDYPEDYRLGETLAWRYDEAEDSAAARRELRRVIDLEQNPVAADDEYGSMEARRYRQRRAHETLSRRDSFTLASTWSPAGVTTAASPNAGRRASSQNVQMAIWDHALGEEPTRNGKSLSVYGRALAGAGGRKLYNEYLAAGVGLRYKPIGDYNLNLYAELYKQNEYPDGGFDGERWNKIWTPEKFERRMRNRDRYAQTSTDYLLRATASFLDQGEYRNDWRVDEQEWNERSLYLDAAWWTKAGDHQWLSRFQQGHVWKLHTESAQTLMLYGFGEFSTQDPDNDWRQDLRSGIGLRWQLWYGDSRYNAFPAHVTVRTEYQLGLGGNLYERANGWLLGVEVNF
ncbi:phage receptor [Pseudomonas sp. zfem001]|uniref:NfrA family protein n=1 Tax=Pseudomonas sp. zfem001 TaxID=3078196 RepID=UPI0029299A9D|nr:phage receptor [Pseudomonas sp. zfem001]MDU9410616.1 phage receptor [Pseudomonas sp. zfem001]